MVITPPSLAPKTVSVTLNDMNNNPTIEVPRAWFEELLKIANEFEKTIPTFDEQDGYSEFLHGSLPRLIGYIQSVKLILK